MPAKKFQWLRHDQYSVRLIGVMYKHYPVRVLHIGLWVGKFRWEIDT